MKTSLLLPTSVAFLSLCFHSPLKALNTTFDPVAVRNTPYTWAFERSTKIQDGIDSIEFKMRADNGLVFRGVEPPRDYAFSFPEKSGAFTASTRYGTAFHAIVQIYPKSQLARYMSDRGMKSYEDTLIRAAKAQKGLNLAVLMDPEDPNRYQIERNYRQYTLVSQEVIKTDNGPRYRPFSSLNAHWIKFRIEETSKETEGDTTIENTFVEDYIIDLRGPWAARVRFLCENEQSLEILSHKILRWLSSVGEE